MNVIRFYFLFILFLHVSIPLLAYEFLGLYLRLETNLHTVSNMYPYLWLTLICFFLGMWLGTKRFILFKKIKYNHQAEPHRLNHEMFIIMAIIYLLCSSFLRLYLGIHSYLSMLLMHVNFGILIFLLLNVKKSYFWPIALIYLPFVLLNGSKGDPVWWTLIIIFTYSRHIDRINLIKFIKYAFLGFSLLIIMLLLIQYQQVGRGDSPQDFATLFLLTFGNRMYGLEGYLLYLESPRLYNVFYSQLSEILQFLPNADNRPGVTFSKYYYNADYNYGYGISSMYSSFFIIPHYLLSFFGIIILGFIIERMLQAASSGSSIMTACFVYWFVQSVTFINGALSWALLNVVASYLVLRVLVYLNQGIFFRRSNF